MALIIKHYLPATQKNLIQVHNYVETLKSTAKLQNWEMLNKRILSKFNVKLSKDEM